jgi:hypothetical protein
MSEGWGGSRALTIVEAHTTIVDVYAYRGTIVDVYAYRGSMLALVD